MNSILNRLPKKLSNYWKSLILLFSMTTVLQFWGVKQRLQQIRKFSFLECATESYWRLQSQSETQMLPLCSLKLNGSWCNLYHHPINVLTKFSFWSLLQFVNWLKSRFIILQISVTFILCTFFILGFISWLTNI